MVTIRKFDIKRLDSKINFGRWRVHTMCIPPSNGLIAHRGSWHMFMEFCPKWSSLGFVLISIAGIENN